MRICHICESRCADGEWCAVCIRSFPQRTPADEMTGDERGEALQVLYGPLEIPANMVHQRIEELVGRSVFTHEMGFAGSTALIAEARGERPRADMDEIVGKLPEGMRVVLLGDGGSR